ncbi:unnamed protein product, partial [Mesorhabditis spiculigera]
MKFLVFLAAGLALALAQSIGQCNVCHFILAQAINHQATNHDNKTALESFLLSSCQGVLHIWGPAAFQFCHQDIAQNMDTIYADVEGKVPMKRAPTCTTVCQQRRHRCGRRKIVCS